MVLISTARVVKPFVLSQRYTASSLGFINKSSPKLSCDHVLISRVVPVTAAIPQPVKSSSDDTFPTASRTIVSFAWALAIVPLAPLVTLKVLSSDVAVTVINSGPSTKTTEVLSKCVVAVEFKWPLVQPVKSLVDIPPIFTNSDPITIVSPAAKPEALVTAIVVAPALLTAALKVVETSLGVLSIKITSLSVVMPVSSSTSIAVSLLSTASLSCVVKALSVIPPHNPAPQPVPPTCELRPVFIW